MDPIHSPIPQKVISPMKSPESIQSLINSHPTQKTLISFSLSLKSFQLLWKNWSAQESDFRIILSPSMSAISALDSSWLLSSHQSSHLLYFAGPSSQILLPSKSHQLFLSPTLHLLTSNLSLPLSLYSL